jgi:recombination DNA repair RAD52 pathway protein
VDDFDSAAVFPERAKARVHERYRWEAVTDAYERALGPPD